MNGDANHDPPSPWGEGVMHIEDHSLMSPIQLMLQQKRFLPAYFKKCFYTNAAKGIVLYVVSLKNATKWGK